MSGKYVLYEHKNKANGKRYIGITCDIARRWSGKGNRYKNSTYFWRAIQKYGWDRFEHKILISNLSFEQANDLEKHFIKKFKTQKKKYGYNLTAGGSNAATWHGKHHTAEARRKMSEAAKGRKQSKEQRRRHSECMKGMLVGKRNGMSRAVRCVNTGEVFESQSLAAQAKGVLQSKISLCCNGFQKHTHGLLWEYADDTED